MPFEEGNQLAAGRKPKQFDAALKRAITQEDGKRLREAAEQLLDQAAAGEAWAIRELADRLDGKPSQTLASDPDNPFTLVAKVEREIIDAKNTDR
jgi:hypothetical protein